MTFIFLILSDLQEKLYIEPEKNDISVLHHVVLTFHADKSFFLRSDVGTAV